MQTYCGKNCEACTYKEELSCPGCQSGPGRVISGDCKLARCCRDKGHETCDTCGHKRNCGIWLDKGSIPKQRIERQKEAKEQQEMLQRRAPFLGKWLWIMFWLVVPSEIAGIMTMDSVVEAAPGLKIPGTVLAMLCSLVYAVILLRISSEHELYGKAGWLALGRIAMECIGFAMTTAATGIVLFFAVAELVFALLTAYYEYKAHGEAVLAVDASLSEKWDDLWKWQIYSMVGLFGSAFVLALIPLIGFLLMLASVIATVVVSILKLVYLKRTAQAFRTNAE